MKPNDRVEWLDVAEDCDREGILLERLRIKDTESYCWEVEGSEGGTYIVEESVLSMI